MFKKINLKNTIGKPIHSIDENRPQKKSKWKFISDLKPKWSSLKITFILNILSSHIWEVLHSFSQYESWYNIKNDAPNQLNTNNSQIVY